MGENSGGWDMGGDNLWAPPQASEIDEFFQAPLGATSHHTEEVQEAVNRAIPAMVEAMKGMIQMFPQKCQCAQEIRDLMPNMGEELVKKAIPQLVEALRSEIALQISSSIPGLVREELKKMSPHPSSRLLPQEAESSKSRNLQLQFVGTLPVEFATLNDIKDAGASLVVELQDSSGSRVEIGQESSAKVKIFVLDGDFDRDEWTEEDFNQNVVEPRKDRGPVLKGKTEVSMCRGVAGVDSIAFTDNSSRSTKNGFFRLGAQSMSSRMGIKEAVSKPFKVKDRRGQCNKKHETPKLEDDICRLQNIAQKGEIRNRLVAQEVVTVKDFMQLYNTDEKELQKIAGISGKKWQETVNHAKLCELSDEFYEYSDNNEGVDLVMNCVFALVSAKFIGKSIQCHEIQYESQKEQVNKVRRKAYKNRRHLISKSSYPANLISLQPAPEFPHTIMHTTRSYLHVPSGNSLMPPSSSYHAPGVMPLSQLEQPIVQNQGLYSDNLNCSFINVTSNLDAPAANQGHSYELQGINGPAASLISPFQPDLPILHATESFLEHQNAFEFAGSCLSEPWFDTPPMVASTSTPVSTPNSNEFGAKSPRRNSVRAAAVVVMFRIRIKQLSVKHQPRALKRQKLG